MKIRLTIAALLVLLLSSTMVQAQHHRGYKHRYTVYNREANVHEDRHHDAHTVYDGDRVLYRKTYHSSYWRPHYYDHEYMGMRRHGHRGYHAPRDYRSGYYRD